MPPWSWAASDKETQRRREEQGELKQNSEAGPHLLHPVHGGCALVDSPRHRSYLPVWEGTRSVASGLASVDVSHDPNVAVVLKIELP